MNEHLRQPKRKFNDVSVKKPLSSYNQKLLEVNIQSHINSERNASSHNRQPLDIPENGSQKIMNRRKI